MRQAFGAAVIGILALSFTASCGTRSVEAPGIEPPVVEAPADAVSRSDTTTGQEASQDAGQPMAPETGQPAEPGASADPVSFREHIQPIMLSRCIGCHGGDKKAGGLGLETYADIVAGSEDGPVVVAGDAANSSFVQLVVSGDMPKQGPKLTHAELQLLIDWVHQGALDN